MASLVPTPEWLPEGMDPKSSFLLEIKILANSRTRRKDYNCFAFTKVVDCDTTNFKDFVESIVDEFPPNYKEVVTIQYYDEGSKSFPRVETDQHLMAMFEKYTETKVVTMFVLHSDPHGPQQIVTEWPMTSSEILHPDVPAVENTPSMTCPSEIEQKQQPCSSTQPVVDDENYLANPVLENEHVGVDEECIYLGNEIAVVDKGKDKVAEEDSEHDSESDSETESEPQSEYDLEEELAVKDREPDHILNIDYDRDDPPMNVGSIYPNIDAFKLALSQHAIKNQFEYNTEKSDPGRFRVYCSRKAEEKCPWRLHASTLDDNVTIQVKKNPFGHACTSTRRTKKVKNATKFWICEKVKDWLVEDSTLGAKELRRRLKEHHKVKINYKRVYMGKELALRELFGPWESSFDNLYRFKAEIEKSSPGSFVVIDHHKVNDKIRFRRLFFALKPCIDGFLSGCRPYLAIDSTFLTGKYKGQLATAVAVDGHNWMYPVAFGVMDSESNENWIWFM